MNNTYSYLALGDSYTIGENLPLIDSYPYQAVQLLRKSGRTFHAPEIIAQTGWTTSDLLSILNKNALNPLYDFVSLLIGVNNQYKGLPSLQYGVEFEELLLNWGLTPYARGRDTTTISREISLFNSINRALSKSHGVNYINITSDATEILKDPLYFSGDGLHPSPKTYGKWAELLAGRILSLK
jgi:hypothetical protein